MRANEFIKEDFSDDLGNIYALHPGAAESEKIALKITDMDEDDFSEAWTNLPEPYQQEFGYDLPLWDLEYLKEYPHMTVKQVTFDQYVELVTDYIRSEDVLNTTLNRMRTDEFLDDRKRDDDDEISKIVSTTDRLLKQGYRVDLHVVGAMGRVYRADFDQTGFTPNGALAFKRKTRTFMRPFLIDDDEKYDFEMVAPKHYKIVDSFTKSDQG